MGDVINLNKLRKARARRDATETAAANRVRFGRTGAEKAKAKAEAEREARRIDGHALEDRPADRPAD
jgi:hypothetical protein